MHHFAPEGAGGQLKADIDRRKLGIPVAVSTTGFVLAQNGQKYCKICHDRAYEVEKQKNPLIKFASWDLKWYLLPTINLFGQCSEHTASGRAAYLQQAIFGLLRSWHQSY